MSLSSFRCRVENCNFGADSKDEKVWDSHYQSEHGISIYNDCVKCGKRFIAVWTGFTSEDSVGKDEDKIFHKKVCSECGKENPLEKLFVERPKPV